MTSKKKNTFESNAVQNRFTAYALRRLRHSRTRQIL